MPGHSHSAGAHIKVAHITTVDMSLRYLLLNQLVCLQSAGFCVVGVSAPGPDVSVIEAASIRHIPIRLTRNFSPGADLIALRELVGIIRRERFTIVHTHTPKPGLIGQLAARIARVPVIVNTLHGFYFHDLMPSSQRRFYGALEKIAARCSDVILSQSREDMNTAIRDKICRPEQIKHLGNGIDLAMFNPSRVTPSEVTAAKGKLGIPLTADVVGFVGRLAGRRKGFLSFLHACQLVRQQLPDTYFITVGEADHGKPDAVEPATAADHGLADRMIFLGKQPNAELPLLYCAMNVLVLPSLFEGVPRVLMEASAMKVPVVATNVKGNREAVFVGQNGFLVPWGDDQSLTQSIVTLLQDRLLAQSMGENGRRIALSQFDEQLVFAKVKAEYARLLQARGLSVPVPSKA